MIDIRVIPNRNICFVKLSAQTTENQLIDAKQRIFNALNVLGDKKILVSDISEFKQFKPELLNYIREIQEQVIELGVTKIIRIVTHPTAQDQMAQNQEKIQANYEAVEVKSLSEAMIVAQK